MTRVQTAAVILTTLLALVLIGALLSGRDGAPDRARRDLAAERGERVRVEVLNAAGLTGLARQATDRLRDQGFDVVYYGNADTFGRDTSLVLDRIGDLRSAQRVAEAAGIQRVRSAPDSSLYVDVTVILGRDWEGAAPAPSEPRNGPERRP